MMRRASSSGNMATLLGGGGGEHDSAHASDDARASYVSALQLRLEMQTKQNNLLRSRLAAQEVLGERERERERQKSTGGSRSALHVCFCALCVFCLCVVRESVTSKRWMCTAAATRVRVSSRRVLTCVCSRACCCRHTVSGTARNGAACGGTHACERRQVHDRSLKGHE